ncbi:sugar phosphate isomerase/epimerase [Ruminococcaceae bacterium OttesenSCG-928-L11]|nr:sugar phosphate isomerase/epimerase [Ruminococcaceae bacterium OttesenSCG-928-L11]
MDKRYIQLYSLGECMQKDFIGSLRRVKEIGYTGVEFAGGFYGGLSAAELKATLAEIGLDPISSHISLELIPGHLDYAVELGVRYLIVPVAIFSTYDEALALARELDKVGKLCAERGIKLGYHNHHHEFYSGKDGTLMETLFKHTDPANVCFQLDVGWASCTGIDCPAFLKQQPNRVALIHVKECAEVVPPDKLPDFSQFEKDADGNLIISQEFLIEFSKGNKWNGPTGQGIVDWPAVRDAALSQGIEAFITEREYNYSDDIFECIQADCDYLKSL